MDRMYLRLKKLRETIGISQDEFGGRIGLKGQQISKYERNIIRPSSDILYRIRTEYNANLNWLVAGTGEMFDTIQNELTLAPEVAEQVIHLIKIHTK